MSSMDTTRPNISRVYDYMLGGHHNFEVDRAMAQQILQIFPSYPVWARLNRWFLQMIASQWADQGFKYVIDLGSGMPTQDHFHTTLPEARVVYSDNDTITVAYAREVIGDNPRVRYLETDVSDVPAILTEANTHFNGQRQVAVGCIGIGYFFDDQTLATMLKQIHAWTAPGSVMAMSFISSTARPEEATEILSTFQRLNTVGFVRTPEQMQPLVAPWQIREVRPLSEWLGVEKQIDPNDKISQTMEMYGAILER